MPDVDDFRTPPFATTSRNAADDPLIRGLFDRLPPLGCVWPENDRKRWLTTAAAIFDLLYQPANDSGPRR